MATLTLKKKPSQNNIILHSPEKNEIESGFSKSKKNQGYNKAYWFLKKFPIFNQNPPLRMKKRIFNDLLVIKNTKRKWRKFTNKQLRYAVHRYASMEGYPLDGPRFDLNCEEVDENLYT